MVYVGWLLRVELLTNDACFVAMLIALVITIRRKSSAPLILLMLAVSIYVALRLVEWLWKFALNREWIDASSIKSIYWTWEGIAKTTVGVAFAIGFCWHLLTRRRMTD